MIKLLFYQFSVWWDVWQRQWFCPRHMVKTSLSLLESWLVQSPLIGISSHFDQHALKGTTLNILEQHEMKRALQARGGRTYFHMLSNKFFCIAVEHWFLIWRNSIECHRQPHLIRHKQQWQTPEPTLALAMEILHLKMSFLKLQRLHKLFVFIPVTRAIFMTTTNIFCHASLGYNML